MSISLLGSINVCKVNTGYANKIQSDRFENPDAMTCPLWNGQDSFGRFVHPDSFYTKNGGCNSADDRVAVENFLRPQYMEYVALDASGFRSPMVGGGSSDGKITEHWDPNPAHNQLNIDARMTAADAHEAYKITGSVGYQYGNNNTLRDTGYNGVTGGGPSGCGRRFGNKIEGFTYDTRGQENYDNRTHMEKYQNDQANCVRCGGGF
jgi:hypothetical protein